MSLIAISTSQIKKYQRTIFSVGIGLVVIMGAFLLLFGLEKAPPPKEKMNEMAPLYDVTRALEDKSFWVFKSEQRLAEQEKQQAKLMNDIEDIRAVLNKPQEVEAKTQLEILQNRIIKLEQTLAESKRPSSEQDIKENSSFEQDNAQPFVFNAAPNINTPSSVNPLTGSRIFSDTLTLSHSLGEPTRPHYESYIPAGSYVKAVLLSGVDISAGVSSQANPQPVLLRLTHWGSLPNKFFGRLKDCRIIAAAFGELSSERAQFRLEKLSCIEPNGRVIETDVDGFISGEDGKNGMRGRLVMRDAEVLKRGFMGGLLSGLGKATSQSFNTTSISPLGSVSTVKGSDVFKQAGAEGAGNAFELMAKYNIQRAEQYQPVIQISADREVYVVFHSGRQFGEQRVEPAVGPQPPQPKMDNFFGGTP